MQHILLLKLSIQLYYNNLDFVHSGIYTFRNISKSTSISFSKGNEAILQTTENQHHYYTTNYN